MEKINEKNFKEKTEKGLVLVDFFATWCGPCRMQSAVIEEVLETNPEINVLKIDVDESPNVARQFGIMSIPTLILMKDGKVLKKHVGLLQNDDLIDFYKNN